jgi:hypothetical protein
MQGVLHQLLVSNSKNEKWRDVVAAALRMIAEANTDSELGPSGAGQSAKEVAELHAFRRSVGYYKPGSAVGLEHAIESLNGMPGRVHLGVIETDRGVISMWLDDQNALVGIIVVRKI